MKTGFIKLDEIVDLEVPQLILLASRPAMGKSTLAYNIAKNLSLTQNETVLFFNLETTKRMMINKLISSETDIEGIRIIKRRTNIEEKSKIKEMREKLSKTLLYINDTTAYIEEICKKVREIKNKKDVKFLVIDYLQLVGSIEESKLESEQLKVIKMLKEVSIDLNIPVLVLSQLSRAPENRKEHRPVISDIERVDGIIDNVDTIMFLYRNDYYYWENRTEIAEVIIAKNITDKIGVVELKAELEYCRFVDIK